MVVPIGTWDLELINLADIVIHGHLHSHQTSARKRWIWLRTDGERKRYPKSACVQSGGLE